MEHLKDNCAEKLVDFYLEKLPAIQANWQRGYNEGYQARIDCKPRTTHGRHAGIWLRGWDTADKELSSKLESKF